MLDNLKTIQFASIKLIDSSMTSGEFPRIQKRGESWIFKSKQFVWQILAK